ncbi:Nn.00g078660.m01.CDS01 [Neocucurbitaria sp. VM-36]
MTSPFSPEELAYLEAHKHDSRVPEIRWVYSVPIAAATLSTVMRLWAKQYGRNGITLDDYLILIATICLIGQCASGLGFALGPPHGMGRHVIVVSDYDQMMVRKGDYVFSHFYDIALVSVKLGILAFYYRVFVHPVFRRVVLATAAFVLAWGIGITVTLFLACRPLAAYWDTTVTGKCLVMVTFVYFTNISNLITDIWIFLMPVPMIWHLQLQTKKKMVLSLIFCIGLATCVVSSIRLTVVLGRGSADFTWYYVPLGAYSVFEPLGGILCTNLPIIWHMFRKRKAAMINASAFKTHNSNSTPTISSRRSRFAIALGITTRDRTQNDSGNRTMLGGDGAQGGAGDWQRLESMESQKPDPTIWTTVERVDTGGLDEGPSEVQLKPGMKKTVWNVRK